MSIDLPSRTGVAACSEIRRLHQDTPSLPLKGLICTTGLVALASRISASASVQAAPLARADRHRRPQGSPRHLLASLDADGSYGFNYNSKNYIFPSRAPVESRAIVSRLIFSSDSTLDRLAHGRPSWNDTLHATFPSCVPCLTCGASSRSSPNIYNGSDSDDEYTNNAVRGVRRARADELEGLLADAYRHQRHLAPLAPRPPGEARPRARPGISACEDLICLGTGAGGAWRSRAGTTSCTRPLPLALALVTHHRSARQRRRVGAAVGLRPGASTDDLLARAVLESAPTQPKDVSATDVARRARSGSTASHLEGELETEQDRRTRRKARKKMRHPAAALAEPNTPEFEGFPCSGSGKLPPQPTFRAPPSGYNGIPSPFM
ncbi:hypothetical protein B0H13DRAFT_2673196 [Mycena leptocephala]|nr:hypothetical protein B0H13DRAFT_2673196 [Mycena leptocephala]